MGTENGDISFGDWLRARRKKKHLTQAELAQRISCAVVTIRKIEANERHPSSQLAELLAEHLDIPLSLRSAFFAFARTGSSTHSSFLEEPDGNGYKPFQAVLPPQLQKSVVMPQLPFAIQATAAYLVEANSGQVLLDLCGDQPLYIASTTKIMTAIIAIERGDLDQFVTIEQSIIDKVQEQNSSGYAYLAVGDQILLKDLLYGMLLPSGNDAALAIAQAVGGTIESFVELMNAYAKRLQLTRTHFTNPCGYVLPTALNPFDAGHYSSAADLVQLTRYALSNALFAQVVQLQRYVLPATFFHRAYTWETTNELLAYYPGATGIKTGYTTEAGYCLVFSATSRGQQLIGAILQGKNATQRLIDAKRLLDWGFTCVL